MNKWLRTLREMSEREADAYMPIETASFWCQCEQPIGMDVWTEGAGELCECGGYIRRYSEWDNEDCAGDSK